ncbi:potassium:proton antiporter [Clostridium perfringens]|uniref:potassium:proton antiporter n=1 Tax=Clostridium perfringens TaxID=1502 RepID=UPI000D7121D6|nr:potassium:proton antiporter [Clostridium perfringens]MBO3424434.1 potassium:proton antiporter [Clostridium perfringens]PWX10386.1 potassium:proton antiporter [Clostridium perfringens]PWX37288.1 potassium:proton antiporter [Clostridium perfringens]PWX59101.1 potassium:proton antiporter [Clostridium perfringens]
MDMFINVFEGYTMLFIAMYIIFKSLKVVICGRKLDNYSLKSRIDRCIIRLLDTIIGLVIGTLSTIGLIEIAKTDNNLFANICSLMIVLSFFSYVLKKIWIDNSWLKGLKREIKKLYNNMIMKNN